MKNFLLIILLAFSFSVFAQCPESFHDFSATDINGNELQMSTFAGKKVLVVNTASYCGYTHQYAALQSLYNTYGGPGNPYNFEIIGFPANNFANQEPHGEDSIIEVCNSYGITFTMMSKVSVKDPGQHEIYAWLTKQSRNCVQNAAVTWNFQKFMINPDGTWHGTATPATSPNHSSIVNWITSMTAVEDKPLTETIKSFIYASPSDKTIHVNIDTKDSGPLSIHLYNLTGQALSCLYNGHIHNHLSIDVPASHLSSGVYIVEIKGKGFQVFEKLVIL